METDSSYSRSGGPYTVTFDDGTQKTLNNILIGELGFVPDKVIWKCR